MKPFDPARPTCEAYTIGHGKPDWLIYHALGHAQQILGGGAALRVLPWISEQLREPQYGHFT